MQYSTIFANCVEVSDSNYKLLTAQQQQTFTQAERAFVLEFLANTLASLTTINAECVVDTQEDYVVRYTDALEVMQNLQNKKQSKPEFLKNNVNL